MAMRRLNAIEKGTLVAGSCFFTSLQATFGGLWALSTILYLGWALISRSRNRRLARTCAAVGMVHLGLMVLMPLTTPAKTRARSAQSRLRRTALLKWTLCAHL